MRVFGALLALVVTASTVQADAVDNTKEADALFVQGREALAAGEFPKACKLFYAAQEKQGENPAILINLGLCYEKQDKLASALRWYRKTQTLTQGSTDATLKEYEETARNQVNTLQAKVSKVTFALGLVQEGAELLIDNTTIRREELIVEVDKGPHVIEARMPGMITSREELVVEDNGRQMTFTFKALVAPAQQGFFTKRKIGIVVGGGVFLAATAVSALWANSNTKNPELTDNSLFGDQLPPTLLFTGGLVVGAGIITYAIVKGKPREQRMAIVPTLTNAGGGLAVFRRF